MESKTKTLEQKTLELEMCGMVTRKTFRSLLRRGSGHFIV